MLFRPAPTMELPAARLCFKGGENYPLDQTLGHSLATAGSRSGKDWISDLDSCLIILYCLKHIQLENGTAGSN